jgi:Protein of unknown function (DUF1566).
MLRSIYVTFVKMLATSLLVTTSAIAHNNVVVIPMAGDEIEVPAELTPSTPIANVDTSQNDYTISALTVIDKITGLEWQRQDDDITRTWEDAWNYCSGLDLDGHQDWRLPGIKELQSIFDYGQVTPPAIDQVAFPNTDANVYWSATPDSSNANNAWLIFFGVNRINSLNTGKGGDNIFVRCVR